MNRLTVRLESFVAAIHPLGPIPSRHFDTWACMDTKGLASRRSAVKKRN